MRYTIDEGGVHFEIETIFDADYPAVKPAIPIAEAVETCHAIRDKIDAELRDADMATIRKWREAGLLGDSDAIKCECSAPGSPTNCGEWSG